jgi:molybdopterin/thiamine biosynthesis adenylyltransferase
MRPPPRSSTQPDFAAAEGVAKVELAAAHVRRVNPWTDIATLEADLASLTPGSFGETDVAVLGLDNHRARYQGSRLLTAAKVPYVDVASEASGWQARVTVCDPAGAAAGDPQAPRSCLVCCWSPGSLARAGEDVGVPCAGFSENEPYASSLTMGQRAATLGARETLALAGAIDLAPSVGFEIRDDMANMRVERFAVPADEENCAGHHALACPDLEHLDLEPSQLRLGALARACGIDPADHIVLASREVAELATCVACFLPAYPYRRTERRLACCRHCGGEMVPVRRTRRLRWGAAAEQVSGLPASEWFDPGDRFAVIAERGTRAFAFAASPLEWQSGKPWNAEQDALRFERLPGAYDLERIRRKRLAILGLGHVGAAVLHQIAPLPWAGLVLVDRDRFESRNAPAYPLLTTPEAKETRA